MAGLDFASGLGQLLDKEAVEFVSRKAERGLGKCTARKNRRAQREKDVGRLHSTQAIESWTQAKGFNYGDCTTAQVFPTDPMTRIGACIVKQDGHTFLTKLKPEGETGQASSKNRNRFQGHFSAQKKWVKSPIRRSVRDQSERLGHMLESS